MRKKKFNEEQEKEVARLFPLMDNYSLAEYITQNQDLFKGVTISYYYLKTYGCMNCWHKLPEVISRLRTKQAQNTNHKRWGAPL